MSICTTCGNEVTGFRDSQSCREFHISGMCQHCQDVTFTVSGEYEAETEQVDFESLDSLGVGYEMEIDR